MENMEKFTLRIDHPMLQAAKTAMDACLNALVCKAIATGSMEGTAKLNISFSIADTLDEDTGEIIRMPEIEFKAGYSVPLKGGTGGKIIEKSRLQRKTDGGWMLINGQITMDELMEERA